MTDFDYYLTFGKRYLAMSVLAYIIGAYTALNINTNIDFSTFTIYSASYTAAVAIICVPFLLLIFNSRLPAFNSHLYTWIFPNGYVY